MFPLQDITKCFAHNVKLLELYVFRGFKVFVTVTDVNDNPPVLPLDKLIFTVPEGRYTEPIVIGQGRATDADIGVNGQLHYRLKQSLGLRTRVFVNDTCGEISIAGIWDREFSDSYQVTLLVRIT